jgi:hypothetical protein
VTRDQVEATIAKTEYLKLGQKTTVALLTLVNGFEVVGFSSCVDPAKYNEEIGNKIARDRAFDEVWKLEGYSLQKSHPVCANLGAIRSDC